MTGAFLCYWSHSSMRLLSVYFLTITPCVTTNTGIFVILIINSNYEAGAVVE